MKGNDIERVLGHSGRDATLLGVYDADILGKGDTHRLETNAHNIVEAAKQRRKFYMQVSIDVNSPRSEAAARDSTVDVRVSVIEARCLRNPHILRLKPAYLVEIQVEYPTQQPRKTSVGRLAKLGRDRKCVEWNEDFSFHSNFYSRIRIRLYCTHGRQNSQEDHIIGETTLKLLEIRRNEEVEVILHNSSGEPMAGSLFIYVKVDVSVNFAISSTLDANVQSLYSNRQREMTQSLSSEDFNKMSPAWTRLFNSLGNISVLAEKIAELDTRAKIAVGALIFALKVVIQQINRDERAEGLIGIMDDLYVFFLDADPMRKILSFQKVLQRLLAQTAECAYFIAEYRRIKLFAQRAVVNLVSNADTMITKFEAAFGELKIELILGSSLQTAVVTFRILETVRNIENLMYIDSLSRLKNVDEDSGRVCIRGTCQHAIDEVISWASISSDAPGTTKNLYILLSPPEAGKSSIAHTVTSLFRLHGRVGAAVFLSDRTDGKPDSHTLSSTIAFQLGHYHQNIKERMAAKIQADFSLASADIGRQFPDLVISSIDDVLIPGPVLLVIDGLHLVPNPAEQHRFLMTVVQCLPRLPPNFRVFVTARHGDVDHDMLNSNPHCLVRQIGLDDAGQLIPTVKTQIQENVRKLFSERPIIISDLQYDEFLQEIETRAMGIPFWVSVVFKVLFASNDRDARLFIGLLRSGRLPLLQRETMGHLYNSLLQNLQPREISIFSVFRALQRSTIPILFDSFMESKDIIHIWVKYGIIVDNSQDSQRSRPGKSGPLYALHPSFEDFLSNPELFGGAPLSWTIGSQVQNCLNHMNSSLRYNICELEDPMLSNSEILDKQHRLHQKVDAELLYACCNWAFYLGAAIGDKDLLKDDDQLWEKLDKFLFTHLLHWIELMSISGSFDLILPSLENLAVALKKYDKSNHARHTLTIECIQLINAFSTIISESAMQIYISAFPLIPSDTLLFKHYSGIDTTSTRYPSNPECVFQLKSSNAYIQWQTSYRPLKGPHYGSIRCATIHDYHIAFGFSDSRTVLLRDAASGREVKTHIRPISSFVSLAFSPDGKQIATAQEDAPVIIYNVESEQILHSFHYHLDQMFFAPLLFYSTNGESIMAVNNSEISKDIWIQNSRTGEDINHFQVDVYGDASQSFALSSKQLAVSKKSGIEMIDINSGKTINSATPYAKLGDNVDVYRLAWSPNGDFLAIAVTGHFLCLWSIQDDSIRYLHYHGHHVENLQFSSDSSRLLAVVIPYDEGQNQEVQKIGLYIWDTYTARLAGRQEIEQEPWNIKLVSFLPGARSVIVCSESPERRIIYYSDHTPAHMTNSQFASNMQIPTIHYTRAISFSRGDFASSVDSQGWVYNITGNRLLWVPYPNYHLSWTEGETLPSSENVSTVISQPTVLEITDPETMHVVLKYFIDFVRNVA